METQQNGSAEKDFTTRFPRVQSTDTEAERIIAHLGLKPLPGEGGFYAETWAGVATGSDERPVGTAIYFLITPESFSVMHRLLADEVWHFYAGDPVEHITLTPSGLGYRTILGSDVVRNEIPQFIVPGRHWQGARLAAVSTKTPTRGWALLGCTMAPGWDEREFSVGDRDMLLQIYPRWGEYICALTRAN